MTRRLARHGLVLVVVVVGLALCAGPAGAKVRGVAGNGVVTVGEVPCGAAPCTLRAPSRVKVTVGGEGFRARVLVPRRIASHARAAVRVKFGAKALKMLVGKTAAVRVRVVLSSAGRKGEPATRKRLRGKHVRVVKRVLVLRTKVGRPTSSAGPGSSGGNDGSPTPSGPPASAPIEGEPPVLARPSTAVSVSDVQLSWSPRDSWVRYVSSGTATNDGVVPGAGATAVPSMTSPCPDRPSETGVALNYTINFPPKESWYDPLTGEAGVYASGNVAFRYTGHSINLTASEPEIEINGSSSRAIFRFSGSGGTPYPNQRVALEALNTAGQPTVSNSGKTLTYSLMRGRLTSDGEKVFAGFYTALSDNEFGCLSASITLP
jgi:hypothetical protein